MVELNGDKMTETMGVMVTRFFVRPSERLQSRIAQFPSQLGHALGQCVLWSKVEGQRTTWTDEDGKCQIKLTFLASLKNDYCQDPAFEILFGSFPLNVLTFDEFWTIEQVVSEEALESAEQELEGWVIDQLQKTGRPLVDAWISQLQIAKATQFHPATTDPEKA